MATFTVTECMTDGCSAPLSGEQGAYYCAPCIAVQIAEAADERDAFDAYHRWADHIARVGRGASD